MSQFRANENYNRHVANMDYTSIQNAKAKAMDDSDWKRYDELQAEEDTLVNTL